MFLNARIIGLIGICTFLISKSEVTTAQITVLNPSFEDTPSDATVPQGWMPCENFTTPDIFPGYWGVYNEPYNGQTYVGLITRENGTWESIGQRLSSPLSDGVCYTFSIYVAHSNIYAGYNEDIKLKIYLGQSICEDAQLIYDSGTISHEQWKEYRITFNPDKKYTHIILEAYSDLKTKKGNILLDNMSDIKFCGRA